MAAVLRDLADLLPRTEHRDELRWHFQDAAGALGAPSSYGAMVTRLQLRGGGASRLPDHPDDKELELATRDRLVRRALELLGHLDRQALQLCYGAELEVEEQLFGQAAGVVPTTAAAARGYAASRSRRPYQEWLVRLARRAPVEGAARVVYSQVRFEAEARLGLAGQAYARARRRVESIEQLRHELASRARRERELLLGLGGR